MICNNCALPIRIHSSVANRPIVRPQTQKEPNKKWSGWTVDISVAELWSYLFRKGRIVEKGSNFEKFVLFLSNFKKV